MVEYVGSQAATRARRREAAEVASFVRRLDWLLIGSVGALIGYGLWGIAGITRQDVAGNPDYYVTRQGIFVAVGLVFLQPDFGTAMVYLAALGAALFVAGVRWLHLALVGAAVVLAAVLVLWVLPAVGIHMLAPYQADRLTGFLHPDNDPRGTTYNITQSKTAIGL